MEHFSIIKDKKPVSKNIISQKEVENIIQPLNESDIIEIKNSNDLSVANKILSEKPLNSIDFLLTAETGLNSIKYDDITSSQEDKQHLFESLTEMRNILSKNNKRWGHSYHLSNVANKLYEFINKKINDIQLENTIHSLDNSYHKIILNEYISGGKINPIYLDYSSVKPLISDIQNLIFDFVVLTNRYIRCNETAVNYVSGEKLLMYKKLSNLLVSNLLSSAANSMLFDNTDEVKKLLKGDKKRYNEDVDGDTYGYTDLPQDNLIEFLSTNIKSKSLAYDVWSMKITSPYRMTQFVGTSGFAFNMKIRNIIKNYTNVTREILHKIDVVNNNPNLYKNLR